MEHIGLIDFLHCIDKNWRALQKVQNTNIIEKVPFFQSLKMLGHNSQNLIKILTTVNILTKA